jgi:hypothetical protein
MKTHRVVDAGRGNKTGANGVNQPAGGPDNIKRHPMATSTPTLAASRRAHDRPTVPTMGKRKLQLAISVLFLIIWVVSVALVGFLVRHGGSLRSSMSAASLLTTRLDLALHPNAGEQRTTSSQIGRVGQQEGTSTPPHTISMRQTINP